MILGIDTATDTMSIALFNEGQITGELTTNLKKNHSVRLLPAIQELMRECGVAVSDLTKIAVSKGPGSYTGLRIGVTVAKTLAWDLNVPIVGISSLQILAKSGMYFPGKIVALMDARRENVYAGVYRQGDVLETLISDQHIALTELLLNFRGTSEKILFIGTIPLNLQEKIAGELGQHAVFASADTNFARAASLVTLAEHESGTEATNFTPDYLKLAEAESKWLEARKKI